MPNSHEIKISHPLVVLDLETTGTWIEKDRIIEIAMIRCDPAGHCETFVSRVNPGMPIPERVTEITGISDKDVKDAPTFKEIAQKAMDFIGDSDLAGFNIERFDLLILEREFFVAGMQFEWRSRTLYDAQKIYHFHERRDLKAAYQFYCGKELANAHTALGDTEATLEILLAQLKRYGDPKLGAESLKEYNVRRADDFFDSERKFRWWNGELYPVFGKYARKLSVKEIAAKDPKYLEWLTTTDFRDDVKIMLKAALAGRFPAYDNGSRGNGPGNISN